MALSEGPAKYFYLPFFFCVCVCPLFFITTVDGLFYGRLPDTEAVSLQLPQHESCYSLTNMSNNESRKGCVCLLVGQITNVKLCIK